MIEQKLMALKLGKLKAVDNIKQFLDKVRKDNKRLNALLYINPNAVEEAERVDKKTKKGKLAGLAFVIKANISVEGMPVSCASKTLEDYNGTFDAEVIKKIKEEDGIIIGIANMDEFAMGASGETSAFGPTKNPAAIDRIPGGSSSGSAAAVAAGFCDIALGSDTGGSIRNPASHCGVVAVKPSYGRVSRYGLVDMAMSLEGIGVIAGDVYGCALALRVISGYSSCDGMTFDEKVPDYCAELKKPLKKLTIGLSKDFKELCTDKRIYELVEKKAKESFSNCKFVNLKFKYVDLAVQTYYPIVYVEVFSGTRKFDGRKYGKKIEDSCGEEVLRRILGGREISRAEYGGKYYRKALEAKQLIAEEINNAFSKVNLIMLPTTPVLPHKLSTKIIDPRIMYAYDAFTIPANLAGVCAGVVNAGEIDNIPVGLQIMAPAFKEGLLLNAMNHVK